MTAAVVLASGPGTRLGALGAQMPKTMLPVAGRPYLEHLVTQLTRYGLAPIVVGVHHHADMITSHFADRARWPQLEFVPTRQRGTGADLIECLPHIPTEDLLVWNGDTVVDLDFGVLQAIAALDPARAVIVLTRQAGVPNEGAFYVDDHGIVLASTEAAPPADVPATFAWRAASTGVVLLRQALMARFSSDPTASLEQAILPSLIAKGQLRAFDNGTGYFLDFGTPDRLEHLHRDGPSLAGRLWSA